MEALAMRVLSTASSSHLNIPSNPLLNLNSLSAAVPPPPPAARNRRRPSSTSSPSSTSEIRRPSAQFVSKRCAGFEPYAYEWVRTHTATELQQLYINLDDGEEASGESDHVSVLGRIMARRVVGKLAFLSIGDDSGVIQVFETVVEPKLIQPTFVLGYPVEISPLAKSCQRGTLSLILNQLNICLVFGVFVRDKLRG